MKREPIFLPKEKVPQLDWWKIIVFLVMPAILSVILFAWSFTL